MSWSLSLCLLCCHLSHLLALVPKETLPPRAQLGDAALPMENPRRSRLGSPRNTTSWPSSSSSAPSSYFAPAGEVQGSGPDRSSFQWTPSGRRTGSLYCRVGIGFHLQIHPDGHVNGSHQGSLLSILEIFAVSQGIVGIRGVFSNKFLAMSKKGKLHASAKFTEDCKFRERFQENSYNTYASAVHRTERTRREWFRQEEPPELAFTVAVPEKKKPPVVVPAKPKVSLPVSRKNSPPVKYRLKFRFG